MADVKKLAEELVALTVLEVNELKNVLKDEYGIEPAAAAVAVAGPAADAGAAEDEQTEFTVTLKEVGGQRLPSSKPLRNSLVLAWVRQRLWSTTHQAQSKKRSAKTTLKLPRRLWKRLALPSNWRNHPTDRIDTISTPAWVCFWLVCTSEEERIS